MKTVKHYLRRLLFMAAVVYLGVVLMMMLLESVLVYHPVTAAEGWRPAHFEGIVDVTLTGKDGGDVHAWWYPHPDATGAVLFLHGNAGNLSHRGGSILQMSKLLDMSVLIVDYPGFGKSPGRPSEAGCYDVGQTGFDWLVAEQKIGPEQILLFGESLGSGIATELAHRQACRGVVLVKPFTSAPNVGQELYPWLPVRWIMRNRFDSLAKVPDIHVPLFIGQAVDDTLVPFAHGERLLAAANEPKKLLPMPGGHNDPLPAEFFVELKQFLKQTAGKK